MKLWSSNILFMIMISQFLFNFNNFCVIFRFFTKLLALGVLFSAAVNAAFVAKLLTSGILFPNSVSFVFLTKLVTLGFFFLILFCRFGVYFTKQTCRYRYYLLLLLVFIRNFLTTSISTTSLSLLKSTGNGANLSMSNLSTSVFGLAQFIFSAKPEVLALDQFLLHS